MDFTPEDPALEHLLVRQAKESKSHAKLLNTTAGAGSRDQKIAIRGQTVKSADSRRSRRRRRCVAIDDRSWAGRGHWVPPKSHPTRTRTLIRLRIRAMRQQRAVPAACMQTDLLFERRRCLFLSRTAGSEFDRR